MQFSLGSRLQSSSAATAGRAVHTAQRVAITSRRHRSRSSCQVVASAAVDQDDQSKTVVVKTQAGDMPFPWSEKDPYRLPISIDRVQKLLISLGWEKPWVEQIVDRIMKNMLKTTEERTQAVVDYLLSLGLKQDEICNMASLSVVLLGLNPETRIKPVVDYLKERGVPENSIADLAFQHPRIFEYRVTDGGKLLSKGQARVKVDVLPVPGGPACAVTYYREGASFLSAPVSPALPLPENQ